MLARELNLPVQSTLGQPLAGWNPGHPRQTCSRSRQLRKFRRQAELSRENAEGDLRTDWRDLPIMHVIDSQQFSQYSLDYIFKHAEKMEKIRPGTPESKQLDGRIMSTLFYEPSTRTRLSFESAMTRLGGQVLSTENAGSFSSAAKGETLEGT